MPGLEDGVRHAPRSGRAAARAPRRHVVGIGQQERGEGVGAGLVEVEPGLLPGVELAVERGDDPVAAPLLALWVAAVLMMTWFSVALPKRWITAAFIPSRSSTLAQTGRGPACCWKPRVDLRAAGEVDAHVQAVRAEDGVQPAQHQDAAR